MPDGTVLTVGAEFTLVDPLTGRQLTAVVLDEAPTGAEQPADSGLDVGERFAVIDPSTGAVLVALVAA